MLELAKLYATVTYFHPRAGARWAEATEAYFPEVLRAPNPETLGRWLSVLDDPWTGVVTSKPEPQPESATPGYTATTAEGWPLLTLSDVGWLLTPEGERCLAGFIAQASRAPAAILDLRTAQLPRRSAAARLATLTDGIAQPALWQRAHYGKVPEAQSATGNFRTGWVGRAAVISLARWPLTAVVLSPQSPVPPFVLALAQLGQAVLLCEGEVPLREPWAPTTTVTLPGGPTLRVRTGLTELPRLQPTRDPLPEARAWLAANLALPSEERKGTSALLPSGQPRLVPPTTRLHAALRLWSALWLLHPHRVALQPELERAWPGFLAQVQAAGDAPTFHKAVRQLLRLTRDGHAVTVTPLDSLLFGSVGAAVRLQTIEGKATVVALRGASELKVGDAVVAVEGVPLTVRRAQLDPYLAAGTPQARENYLNNRVLLGQRGSLANLTLEGGRQVAVPRLPSDGKERQGEVVRVLKGGVVYADLDRLTRPEIAPFFVHFGQAPGLIFDLRGYVEETAWELAPYLAPTEPLIAARFHRPVALPPEDGELAGRHLDEVFDQTLPRRTTQRRYRGRVAVLIDERTQSQAEHTVLFLKACGALLVGSPTAGAVGDVTNLLLSDGIVVRFSGQDVRLPEGTKVAGVGVMPALRKRPTRRGLQAGRDEVLEAALGAILSHG
ncbi:S41 family peptidase [Armatimonas rosea]|uniref:Tail specific protease domain-containing protein n=1 Tax=Armatimonas rosea TaxID=685828 RepID=A0A7W9STD1_ARMRO|nr:S41 family peptidase [Armatimonas rosea]MBB6051584.1 hypothetical protein [Armatimonas rosea]